MPNFCNYLLKRISAKEVKRTSALHLRTMIMGKLRVKCIRCGKEWEKEAPVSWKADDFTSSLCPSCFREVITPIIRRKQRKEGNFDCFGKAGADCDQLQCKYRRWCLRLHEQQLEAS